MVAECREGTRIGGHCVVGEVASHHRPQPTSLFGYVLVPAPPEVFGNFQELRHLAVTSRMTGQQKAAPPRSRADVREAQTVEEPAPAEAGVSGLPSPRSARSDAARLPNSIRRVLSGCSSRANSAIRMRSSARNRSAPAFAWGRLWTGAQSMSSGRPKAGPVGRQPCRQPRPPPGQAPRTTTIAPCAWRRRHCSAHRS
jgi:hypothetical protein